MSAEAHEKLLLFCFIPLGVIFTIASVTANGIFLLTCAAKRNIRDFRMKLLMALSFVDLLQGIFVWGSTLYIFIRDYRDEMVIRHYKDESYKAGETLHIISGYALTFSSVTMLFVIGFEQYFAILYPYKHQRCVNAKIMLIPVLLLNVVLSMTGGIIFTMTIYWNMFVNIVHGILLLSFLTTVYFYIKVWQVSKRVQSEITSQNREEGLRIKKESKAAKTSCLVLITFVICYIPMVLLHVLYLFDNIITASNQFYYVWVSGMFAMSKSTWNPLIFYWRLKAVQKATKQFIRGMCGNHVQPREGR